MMHAAPKSWAPKAVVDWWRESYSDEALTRRFGSNVPQSQRDEAAALLRMISSEEMRPAWVSMAKKCPRDGWELRIASVAMSSARYARLPKETPAERRHRFERAADTLREAAEELFRTRHDLPLAHFLGENPGPFDVRAKRLSSAILDAADRIKADAASKTPQDNRRLRKAAARTFAESMLPFFRQEFGGEVLTDALATMTSVITGEEYSRSSVQDLL